MRLQIQQRSAMARDASALRSAWRVFGALLVTAWLGAPSVTRAEPAPQEGGKLYQQFCAACHTIGGGRLLGPDLQGITERRDHEWLVRFITEPEEMRKDDPVAIANLKEFGVPMPRLGLTEQQTSAILAYLKAAQAPPAGVPAPYIPTLVLSLLGVAALTLIGLIAGTKRVSGGKA
jgi:mono/diheme cytochrome c family protein